MERALSRSCRRLFISAFEDGIVGSDQLHTLNMRMVPKPRWPRRFFARFARLLLRHRLSGLSDAWQEQVWGEKRLLDLFDERLVTSTKATTTSTSDAPLNPICNVILVQVLELLGYFVERDLPRRQLALIQLVLPNACHIVHFASLRLTFSTFL